MDSVTKIIAQALADDREVMIEDFAKLKLMDQATEEEDSVNTLVCPSKEISDKLTKPLGIETSAIDEGVKTYFTIIKEKLIANDKLKIERFLALKITEEKAKIIDDSISGQKLISPAKKVISYMAHPKFKQIVGGKDFAFIPALSLKEGVESIKTSAILLAIPEEDFFTDTLKFHFNREGWKVDISRTMDEALQSIESGATYLVLVDASLPKYQQLCERIKCSRNTSLIPLIVMLPTGADPHRATEFSVMGNEQLAQPFEIRRLISIAEAELQRASEEMVIFAQEVQFQFPTTDDNIDRANEMAATLFSNSGLDEEGQVALCAAFREGLGNSAQHGNRYRRDKVVNVMYLLDQEKITLIVEDEGKGFDWRLYVDDARGQKALDKARKRHQQGKLGGLGIMLMTKCTDKIEYNEQGNTLTEYKYLPGKKPENF